MRIRRSRGLREWAARSPCPRNKSQSNIRKSGSPPGSGTCRERTEAMVRRAFRWRQRTSVRQRIGPKLNVHGTRHGALAAFLEPGRAVAVRAPQPAAFPAAVRVVDPPIEALG